MSYASSARFLKSARALINLFLEYGRTQYHQKPSAFVAAKEWNELPKEGMNANSLNIVKRFVQYTYN